jgi:Do/DeqQ family serine protease
MNFFKTVTISLLAGLTGSALFALFEEEQAIPPSPFVSVPVTKVSKLTNKKSNMNRTASSDLLPSFEFAASRSVDAVVHVRTAKRTSIPMNPWYEMLGYRAPEEMMEGSGSGVIIGQNGFIVTNNHVIEGADEIIVSMNNNRTYPAEIIGTDPSTDIAVLEIQADAPLPFIEFGDSEKVNVGEWVLAVGNPFDLTSTVTAGIVSAKARNIRLLPAQPERGVFPIESFIQTDAAVNPGNSGGALVNTAGELIGINTAIASRTGSYAGYAFAVPSNIAQKVTRDLIQFGEVQWAYLGIQIEPVNEQIAKELMLKEVAGCAVVGILPNSGAADSEIQIGDVLLAVDGLKISSFPELQERMSSYGPGDEVMVQVWRNARVLNIPIQLKDRNGQLAQSPSQMPLNKTQLTHSSD